MKILLTGASGVVGDALLQRLDAAHAVRVLARQPKDARGIACHLENITKEVADAITAFAPELVIHAGWAGTENHERNDPHFMQINIDAGMKLLDIAAKAGCKRWIGFGSQAEYSADLREPIAETAPTEPQGNYGITKLALCRRQQEYASAHGMDFTWLRLFTCYGKNHKPSYVIPYLIETLKKGDMPELKTPHAVWDLLHADDAAEAVEKILAAKGVGGIYNLASGTGISVGEIAMILARKIGFARSAELAAHIADNHTAATPRVADIRKILTVFGWQPRIGIEEGLARCHAQ